MAIENFTIRDLEDKVSEKSHQLHALLEHCIGEAAPAFAGLPSDLQESYLTTCANLSTELVDSLERIGRLRLAARDSKAR